MNLPIDYLALRIAEKSESVVHAALTASFALALFTGFVSSFALSLLFATFGWSPDGSEIFPFVILGLMGFVWYAGNAGREIALHAFAIALVNPDRFPVDRMKEILAEMTCPLDEMVVWAYPSEDMPARMRAAQQKVSMPPSAHDQVENSPRMR